MFSESHPLLRRIIRFALLPYCFLRLVNWKECTKSRFQVAIDLLYIFFVLNDYPDNYGACRLWELDRARWALYYGSNYNPYQKSKLRKEVNPLSLQVVFNDKQVCDLLCRGIGVNVPRCWGTVDAGDDLGANLRAAFKASRTSSLIVKPVYGHAGIGVRMAVKKADGIEIRTGMGSEAVEDCAVLERCIIQEVVTQDPRLSAIAPSSINTIRVLTMYTKAKRVMVIGASMRFGVGDSIVDNWSAGGVAVGVNHETGRLLGVGYDKRGNRYLRHPISEFEFKDFEIPQWEKVVDIATSVQMACTFNRLLGMDVAVTESGVVLIEINADADIVFQEQTSGPLFANRSTWEAFSEYGLFVNRFQKHLYDG